MAKAPRPWLKALVLANFLGGVGVLIWLAWPAARSPQVEVPPISRAAPKTAVASSALRSWDAIAACLDGGGGVEGGKCVEDASVDGFEPGLNDSYFLASKAAVLVVPPARTGAELAERLRSECVHPRAVPQAPSQQPVEVSQDEVSEDEALACVLAELERRTQNG